MYNTTRSAMFVILSAYLFSGPGVIRQAHADKGLNRDLIVLYTFEEGRGAQIYDRSGRSKPVNLRKDDSVKWLKDRGLAFGPDEGKVISLRPANEISHQVGRSKAITVEAWIQPSNLAQPQPGESPPARIVSLSKGYNDRNFTLGQEIASAWAVDRC